MLSTKSAQLTSPGILQSFGAMSRYTASELSGPFHSSSSLSNVLTSKNYPKAALVECIARQPEIQFPKKVSSRPLQEINRKHLLRALTGNFGYIKPVAASLNGAEMRGFQDSFPVVCRFHLPCVFIFSIVQPQDCPEDKLPDVLSAAVSFT